MSASLEHARILVADDEPGIRSGCRRILESCGASVAVAGTGAEALELLAAEDFDVAIVDLIMPTFGGMELLRRLGEIHSPVVSMVITAHATIDTAIEAIKLGAFDYLPKPFVPAELVVRLERAVAWRRLRQVAEEHLLQLDADQSQLHAIVNSLADGVMVINREGQVVLTNPAAREALGLPAEPAAPPPLAELAGCAALSDLVAEVTRSPHSACAFTGELHCGDRAYMARVVAIANSREEFLGTATVLRDVTDLLTLQRARSQFVKTVAHELKSPLAAVQGYLKVILSGKELAPEKLTEVMTRCSERVEGMVQMVRDLLELSLTEALPERHNETLNLAEVVAAALEQNEHLAESLGVRTLAPEIPPDLTLEADRADMLRILTNLVSNGIKYNRPGGSVTISAAGTDEELTLAVTDTGLGIPAEALPCLGQEFFRLNTPDRRHIVGTGLGLALVRRTLEAYGGHLEVDSTPGAGSTFRLTLPRLAG
ncbi:MAG TPA: response regulator [Armatimonadota bacterium]